MRHSQPKLEISPRLEELMERFPECFEDNRWIRVIPFRESKEVDLSDGSMAKLKDIIKDLASHAEFMRNWSERVSADKYQMEFVQRLVDYAFASHYRYDLIKKAAIDAGVAQYNPKTGDFEFIKVSDVEISD